MIQIFSIYKNQQLFLTLPGIVLCYSLSIHKGFDTMHKELILFNPKITLEISIFIPFKLQKVRLKDIVQASSRSQKQCKTNHSHLTPSCYSVYSPTPSKKYILHLQFENVNLIDEYQFNCMIQWFRSWASESDKLDFQSLVITSSLYVMIKSIKADNIK